MNIKDVARLAETSVATVSRVMNNDPKVAKVTRQKVLAIIEESGYIPDAKGRSLRTQRSNKILVLIPTMSNQFYSRILQGVEAKAEEHGYQVLVAITNLEVIQEEKYLDMLKSRHVDGAISFFSTLDPHQISEIAKKYPFVQCCEPTLGADVSSAVIDNREAIYEVTQDFIKKGHKRIAMISGDYYRFSEEAREKGYKDALREANIKFDDSLLKKSFYRLKEGESLTVELMNQKNPPTAIICVSDSLAIGSITALHKLEKKVGKDVDVIGFDNTSITSFYYPTISTIAQPRFDLGTTAVDLLMEKFNDNNSTNKKVILPHTVIHRESTGCAK
ncbi:MAG: LacI family DNA-binding transcriptional regulator [Acholeplasmataceae bacterium]|nr:LacI family DNA-binding transcriptional regulator [Acholeplasmataceae bacterium]